jgi:hypothetical protein
MWQASTHVCLIVLLIVGNILADIDTIKTSSAPSSTLGYRETRQLFFPIIALSDLLISSGLLDPCRDDMKSSMNVATGPHFDTMLHDAGVNMNQKADFSEQKDKLYHFVFAIGTDQQRFVMDSKLCKIVYILPYSHT